MAEVTAVILAGGFGTRLQELYPQFPKPLVPVLGQPFLAWVLRYLSKQGLRKFRVSAGYKGAQIETFLAGFELRDSEISCRIEPDAMGTAGGFLYAVDGLHGPFLVLNGDSLLMTSLAPMIAELERHPNDGCAVGAIPSSDTSRYGRIEIGEEDRMVGFQEKVLGEGWINAGIYGFGSSWPERFKAQISRMPASFEKEIFPSLTRGPISPKVFRMNGEFLDIGTPQTVGLAAQFIRQNLGFFEGQ